MTTPEVSLLQFRYSHFNEKARWALDWKGIPHRRISVLPGPHVPRIRRLTGRTEVPVVRFGDEIVAGSARIVDELERRFPEPPLYPKDPGQRERALAIQRRFDEEVGPAVRRALFAVAIHDRAWLCDTFSTGRSPAVRWLYRTTFPLVKGVMVRSMALDDRAQVAESMDAAQRALDFVAAESAATGQLVGDSFGVADLAAAALLAILVDPDHPDMKRPDPKPPAVQAFLARWAEHPGTAWVREQYRRHRPPSREITGRRAA
jgi:glutathione S-transferase